jgi:hypothetical protein
LRSPCGEKAGVPVRRQARVIAGPLPFARRSGVGAWSRGALASYLRIEERELEAGTLNCARLTFYFAPT